MTTSTANPVPSALQRVITLLLVNLGLSAVLAVLFALFHGALLDLQMQRLVLPADADVTAVRDSLSVGLWTRVAVVVIVAAVYTVLIRRLRQGRRRAYIRVFVLSIISLAGIAYIVFAAQYPWWVLVEQAVQALVLLALLWAVSRPALRQHFATAGPVRG